MSSGVLDTAQGETLEPSAAWRHFDFWDLLLITVLIVLVVGIHLSIPGRIPSGADGGNWLAIARGLTGEDVMASKVAYPPVFPALLALAVPLLGAIPALVVTALLAKALLVVAVYICCRPLGRWYATGAAVCCGVAGAQLEAYAWGGYPQLMGTAFALLTVYFAIRWLSLDRFWILIVALVFGALTIATHALIGGLLLVALPLAVLHWALNARRNRREILRAFAVVLAVLVPGGLFVVLSRIAGAEAGVTAVLNPYDVPRLESIELAIRDAVVPWVLVAVLGIVALAIRGVKEGRQATLTVGSSWTVAGLTFFLVTGEARGLLLTQVGLIILASLTVQWLVDKVGRRDPENGKRINRWAFPVIATLLISMASAILAGGLVAYVAATDWYRVADDEVLEALDWLGENSAPQDLMAASAGPNGNPLGWWVQGYGKRRTYTGIDVRALSFPDERNQAEIANEIFAPSTGAAEAHALVSENGIDFLIVDRRGPDAAWLGGNVAATFDRLYESPTVAILKADAA
jgi:hypothetical protein